MKWQKKFCFGCELSFFSNFRHSKSRQLSRGLIRIGKKLKPYDKKAYLISKRITKVLRRVFEYPRLKQVLGVNLLSFAILLSQITMPASALDTYIEPELFALPSVELETETKIGFQAPLDYFRLTQGFHLFHLGVDLASPKGTAIKPVAQGTVERVEFGRYGYGNSVLINHGSDLKSFYAHLSKINVQEGDEVFAEDMIGGVGNSGRSTGPHLHLEIWQNDRPLNPRTILDLSSTSGLAKAE